MNDIFKIFKMNDIFLSILNEKEQNKRESLISSLSNEIKHKGISSIYELNFPISFKDALKNYDINVRIAIIEIIQGINKENRKIFEPYFIMLLKDMMYLFNDTRIVSEKTELCLVDFFQNLNPYASSLILPYLFESFKSINWKEKLGALKLIQILPHTSPTQISFLLPLIVPKIVDMCWDTKVDVKKMALVALKETCIVVTNPDIKHIVSDLVNANAFPKETVSALDKLMGTTFVSQVERSTLAIIAPLLNRALRDRDVQMKRKACVVITNMCKLVCDPKDVEPFVDKLLPELKRVSEEVPIPEIREYGLVALNTLKKAIKDSENN